VAKPFAAGKPQYVVHLVIAGFQSANEAHKIKKELKG
jgi:hypothetical protein